MIVILSMTGCGYARVQTGNVLLTAEIKSVNSRYLDINCKTPRAYSRLEEKIKALIGTYATRGNVDIYLSAETAPGEADTALSLDEGYLKNYLACLKELRDRYGLKDDISVMSVAANRDEMCIRDSKRTAKTSFTVRYAVGQEANLPARLFFVRTTSERFI